MKKIVSLLYVFSTCYSLSFAQSLLPSSANEWQQLTVKKVSQGQQRQILSGPTKTLEHFEIVAHTVAPGKKKLPFNSGNDQEAFILVKSGEMGVVLNGQKQVLGKNSVFVAALGDKYELFNAGNQELTYYLVNWKSKLPTELERSRQGGGATAIDYQQMDFQETTKGGRRAIMRRPTATLKELEMHITTLNEGQKSHDPHTHFDEEIIVVLSGEVEELINGKPHNLGPGSVIFLSSMDPHGIRNIGKGQCEYYAIRWLSTPEML